MVDDINHSFKILIVDDQEEYRETLDSILKSNGYYTDTASSGHEALEKLKKEKFHLVLTGFIMSGMNGIDLLEVIKRDYSDTEVIVFTGYGLVKNAVDSVKKGGFDYFIKSQDPEELLTSIERLAKSRNFKNKNSTLIKDKSTFPFILETSSERFKKVLDIGRKVANSNANVLILGESGVGKEVFARYIHQNSDRNSEIFVAVNCHAFSETLLESELFGHEKGAFTGAHERRIGRFEAAHEGTLFLDEIGDTSLETQVKLLRTIENKKIERIGSNKLIDVDFRLICATNRDIYKMVADSLFREDLFYRISTITVEIPPLRERREDLPKLINFFFKKAEFEFKKEIRRVEADVMRFLLNYHYPGNVRELKNIVERLVILSDNGIVKVEDIPEKKGVLNFSLDSEKIKTLKEFRREAETEYIQSILTLCNYNMTETAKKLGISRRQLFNKLTEYGLR
ncbi:sigma-54-dependent Fis family transcriptional regulator [Crassaminicella thermophila]|uniref:Stage 0 sporulation protein A homolog n=1 Tax=Crassaminicella thermophila TaxID=2599308 RepID=A0A5C0SAM5_CRATE|nr:sigma-54 dependent transcriptional regulator [Crassaminicella thermophila]QEK11625.1 sigma-54-dependent Fis family transcriptional regulator [Crassaminicella thermophila]